MAEPFRAQTDAPKVFSSMPSTQKRLTVVCNSRFREFDALFWSLRTLHACRNNPQTWKQQTQTRRKGG